MCMDQTSEFLVTVGSKNKCSLKTIFEIIKLKDRRNANNILLQYIRSSETFINHGNLLISLLFNYKGIYACTLFQWMTSSTAQPNETIYIYMT